MRQQVSDKQQAARNKNQFNQLTSVCVVNYVDAEFAVQLVGAGRNVSAHTRHTHWTHKSHHKLNEWKTLVWKSTMTIKSEENRSFTSGQTTSLSSEKQKKKYFRFAHPIGKLKKISFLVSTRLSRVSQMPSYVCNLQARSTLPSAAYHHRASRFRNN